MITKSDIRARMKELEAIFLASGKAGKETEEIWAAVESDPLFSKAETVLVYMDIKGEVPTEAFIRKWTEAKRFIIPRVNGDTLDLCEYDESKLQQGYKGIREPSAGAPAVNPEEIDFALIPGVAFTREGLRLGRGKGYYDRLLPKLDCPCCGIGFSFRWIDKIPSDPWDVPLNHPFSFRP